MDPSVWFVRRWPPAVIADQLPRSFAPIPNRAADLNRMLSQ
jgi:hypothetical protein